MVGNAPSYNPTQQQSIANYLQPTTSLPGSLQVQNPTMMNPYQIMQSASGVDSMLPSFLQMNSSNPLFSSNSAEQAQQQYYNQAIAPQMQSAAEQQFLGGNMGGGGSNSSSTFGSTYLGSMQAQGEDQAFFSGQQYYDNELNNTLNERNNYFGNDVQVPEQYNALSVQGQLGADQQNTERLGQLDNFDLGAAGTVLQDMQGQAQLQSQNNAQKAALLGGLTGGIMGLGGGLLGGGSGALSSFGSGLGSGLFGGGSSSSPFTGGSSGGTSPFGVGDAFNF